MTRYRTPDGPLKARADLVGLLKSSASNTEAIVAIIEQELRGIKDAKALATVSDAIAGIAGSAKVDEATRDSLLYWLTETSPDARQMIIVQTLEELLRDEDAKQVALDVLTRLTSEVNVKMVMEWVRRGVLTLNQAVYVLLYPGATKTLK
ncbi:MAG: hypothetical protein HXY34_09335 [Candidatus Thorarchaeota archaeon]|nr:hypothetical protein [Candidatus Thorarchaeota archaeon]